MLGVPGVPKGGDHLTHNRFAAKVVITLMITTTIIVMMMTIIVITIAKKVTCKQRRRLSVLFSPLVCSCPPAIIQDYQSDQGGGDNSSLTCKFPSMSSRLGAPPMTGSSTLRSSILKLFSDVIRSSSSAVAVDALVESGTMVVCDTACLRIKMTMTIVSTYLDLETTFV